MRKDNTERSLINFSGLRGQFFLLGFIIALLIAISSTIACRTVIQKTMYSHVEDELRDCIDFLDKHYKNIPGDFSLVDMGGAWRVHKGEADITNDYRTMDALAGSYRTDLSIFCVSTRVMTTFMNHDMRRLIGTTAENRVYVDVVAGRKPCFYTDEIINGEKFFAYYRPILNSDGTVFGMYGACRRASMVNQEVREGIIPLVWIFAIATVVIIIVFFIVAQRMVRKVSALSQFMKQVADYDFEVDLPDRVMESRDEIGELARSGKQMQNSIRRLVDYDPLTKIHNRRYGTVKLPEYQERAERTGKSFCVAIGDIDFFKKVNDTYGHDAGDEVLRQIAALYDQHMKKKGFVARWGGEEFLFVFKPCRISQAEKVLKGVVQDVRKLVVKYDGMEITPRVSIGLAKAEVGEDYEESLKRADNALYYAKEHGRDQLCVMPELDEEIREILA